MLDSSFWGSVVGSIIGGGFVLYVFHRQRKDFSSIQDFQRNRTVTNDFFTIISDYDSQNRLLNEQQSYGSYGRLNSFYRRFYNEENLFRILDNFKFPNESDIFSYYSKINKEQKHEIYKTIFFESGYGLFINTGKKGVSYSYNYSRIENFEHTSKKISMLISCLDSKVDVLGFEEYKSFYKDLDYSPDTICLTYNSVLKDYKKYHCDELSNLVSAAENFLNCSDFQKPEYFKELVPLIFLDYISHYHYALFRKDYLKYLERLLNITLKKNSLY